MIELHKPDGSLVFFRSIDVMEGYGEGAMVWQGSEQWKVRERPAEVLAAIEAEELRMAHAEIARMLDVRSSDAGKLRLAALARLEIERQIKLRQETESRLASPVLKVR